MTSLIQILKMLVSGRVLRGIEFRTKCAVAISVFVIVLEIVLFGSFWNRISSVISYGYDWNGLPTKTADKYWLWGNVVCQIIFLWFCLNASNILYKIRPIKRLLSDDANQQIPILKLRFKMLLAETAMLLITTEQSYIFTLAGLIKDTLCDDIVTFVFLFWEIVLLIEFYFDVRALKKNT